MDIFRTLAAPIFAILAVVQAIRFVQAWPVSINGVSIPVWASAIAAIVFGSLAVIFWREGNQKRRP